MLGYHDDQGRLIYAGRVGTGFSEAMSRSIEAKLQTMKRPASPFITVPPKEAGRDVHFVRPQLVAQVRFAGWSADGILRHAVFDGLRDDNAPSDIVRESVTAGIAKPQNGDGPPAIRPRKATAALQPVLADVKGVALTNPGKVLYPDAGITKLDLVKYYVEIADWVLPHMINRPLSLVRCPNGIERETFYQKHAGHETPAAVGRVLLPKHDEKQQFLFIRDLKGLLSLVQIGVLEIHPWGSQISKPDRPDRMIFDLDPDDAVPWPTVIQAALRIRDRLHDAGLLSFVKTTGGKGLHIVVPLERRQSWDDVKGFSHQLAQGLAADYPQSYTVNQSKRARPGKIYLDYRRNSEGATAVAAYSTRARAGAPVSAPIAWDELTSNLLPDFYNVGNLAKRFRVSLGEVLLGGK
jgi:bifunctional non-homologous end joining protein LigD